MLLSLLRAFQKKLGSYNVCGKLSIASIEEIISKAISGTLRISVGDLAYILGTNVYKYKIVPKLGRVWEFYHLIELLNSVRNRILDFVLAILEKVFLVLASLAIVTLQSLSLRKINSNI